MSRRLSSTKRSSRGRRNHTWFMAATKADSPASMSRAALPERTITDRSPSRKVLSRALAALPKHGAASAFSRYYLWAERAAGPFGWFGSAFDGFLPDVRRHRHLL